MSTERTISLADCPEEIQRRIMSRMAKSDKVLFVRSLGDVIYSAYVTGGCMRSVVTAYANNDMVDTAILGDGVGFIFDIVSRDKELAAEIEKRLDQKAKRSKKER